MITKTFQYEGQMINYFNKVAKNPKIGLCSMGRVSEVLTVSYEYKKVKEIKKNY